MAGGKGFMGLDRVVADELKEKWGVLAIAFVCVIFAFSIPAFAPQNIYDFLERDFGWTRTEITLLATAKYITGSIVAIVVGTCIDKIGTKQMLIIVSCVGALAVSSFYLIPNLLAFYGIGIMLGVATTGTIVAIKVLISRSFDYAQGFAMGFTLMGMSVGQLMVPYLIYFFVPENEAFAWRGGMLTLSLGIWFIAIPLMIVGLSEKQLSHSVQKKAIGGESTLGFKDLMREGRFWLIALAVFLVGFVDQAFIQNSRFILISDLKVDGLTYANIFGFYAIIGALSRPALGILIDALSVRGVAIAYTIIGATSLLALPLAASLPFLLYLWMGLRGTSHAGVMIDSAMLSKHCYGRHNLGLIIGVLTAFINIGFAFGPVTMAWLGEAFGSYKPVFVIYAVLAFIAAGVVLLVKPTYWLAAQEARREMLDESESKPSPQATG